MADPNDESLDGYLGAQPDAARRIMDTREEGRETYLGDGCYGSWSNGQIKLRTPRSNGDQIIYFEPEVFVALLRLAKQHWTWNV